MKRRSLIAGAACLPLAAPFVRAAERARVLRFVPNTEPPVLDPVTNTATQTRTHAYLVWDTLYGLDTDYAPHPQMVEGHTVEDDGRQWTLTLRPELRFHDGQPVLSRDVIASIRRWAATDGFGGALLGATDELAELDDRRLRFRLKTPFPLLPNALGKMSPSIAPIMPARLASVPPTQQVKEVIGGGPFRFLASERVPGSRMVYERFDGYVPRQDGPPGFTSGPKRVFFDRIEWAIMPEAATAAAALRAGEIDWMETPSPDLLPMLRADPALVVSVNDTTGVVPILRFNSIQPPFNNADIRRAVLGCVSQADFLAAFSSDKSLQRSPIGVFCPGSPMANDSGLNTLPTHPDIEAGRRALKAAGYGGERVVVLGASDHPVNSVMAQVGADLLKRLGMNVDYAEMDAGTMFQRRANRESVDKGGWSVFPSSVAGIDVLNPAVSFLARGDGPKAWYGWPSDPALEKLRAAWLVTPDLATQRDLCRQIQLEVLHDAPYAPLGQILQPMAYRRGLTGILPGFAKFWGVQSAA